MFADPCNYQISGVFSKATGTYNACTSELEFVNESHLYKIKIENGRGYLTRHPTDGHPQDFSSRQHGVGTANTNGPMTASMLFDKFSQMPKDGISAIEHENFKINTGLHVYDLKDTATYKINVFILNSSERAKAHGPQINKNTTEIFNKVKGIFNKSKMIIEPRLVGILNINDRLDLSGGYMSPLQTFKEKIEPVRFSPFNLRTPLAGSDLVILLAEGNGWKEEKGKVHGMTFSGGSTRLDSSYSVVFTSVMDSTYFVAKKMAHEIGHALGANHHGKGLMEERGCRGCEDEERLFDGESKGEIDAFVKRNERIFGVKRQMKYGDGQPLKTVKEASEYAEERRAHGLLDIVHSRLKGRFPMGLESEASVVITVSLYSLVVLMIIFYWKQT